MTRVPSMKSALKRLKEGGIGDGTLIDVGILKGTRFLSEAFPRAYRHCFEPVDVYFNAIREEYRDIPHELHHVAISSSGGMAFQVGVSADGSPLVTRSYMSEQQIPVGQVTAQGIVQQCTSIEKVTLDAFFASRSLDRGYLVKIDTDGHEMPIISGGAGVIGGADIVIGEAAMHALPERTNAMSASGSS